MNSIHYDLIHSHYWLSGQVGKWLQDRWKVPHMVMFHTLAAVKNATVQEEQESELRIATEKDLAQNCQRILAATEREKDICRATTEHTPRRSAWCPAALTLIVSARWIERERAGS